MAKFKTLLLGTAVGVVILALLVHWIGMDTLRIYRADLWFYLQAHLYLVAVSMVLALLVGIPAGVLLSRPAFARSAERFMQVFNIGNTVPPLAVLAIALGIVGIGDGPAILALFLPRLLAPMRNTSGVVPTLIARATRTPPMMMGTALGSSTLVSTWVGVMPMPVAASLSEAGTFFSPS